jgi:hypothetical protein
MQLVNPVNRSLWAETLGVHDDRDEVVEGVTAGSLDII